eukprot:1221958-Rhodomonas_salina.1
MSRKSACVHHLGIIIINIDLSTWSFGLLTTCPQHNSVPGYHLQQQLTYAALALCKVSTCCSSSNTPRLTEYAPKVSIWKPRV